MALERHRDRARAEFDRVGALREASEFDESNALRTLFP
jgi:purine nucleoside permease